MNSEKVKGRYLDQIGFFLGCREIALKNEIEDMKDLLRNISKYLEEIRTIVLRILASGELSEENIIRIADILRIIFDLQEKIKIYKTSTP